MNQSHLNRIGTDLIGATIEVHKALGPGLLEKLYVNAMCVELKLRGHHVKQEVDVVVRYKNEIIGNELRIDLLVDDLVIVELKSVSQIHPRMQAQLLSYLRLTNLRLGYLINFNEVRLTDGLQRFMNNQQKAA